MPEKWRFATETEPDEDSLQREDDREPAGDETEGADNDDAALALVKENALAMLAGVEALEAGNLREAHRLLRVAERAQGRLRKLNEAAEIEMEGADG